jgi:hypothetical protein
VISKILANLSVKYSGRIAMAMIAVPMGTADGWLELKFSKLKPNVIERSEAGTLVKVDSSASPLIQGFGKITPIDGIEAEIEITGSMNQMETWKDFEEDSFLRIGLVAEGPEKLGTMGSLFAPEWVKRMFALAPKGHGLDKIYFYSVTSRTELIGKSRQHPKSKFMHEEYAFLAPIQTGPAVGSMDPTTVKPVSVSISKKFVKPIPAAGIWLSIDGDDSKSKFEVKIKSLRYSSP